MAADSGRADGAVDAGAGAACGDGIRAASENCEPGGPRDGAACDTIDERLTIGVIRCTDTCELDLSACARAGECGDGELDMGEACDDGNTESFDGCSSICEVEPEEPELGNDAELPPQNSNAGISGLCRGNSLAAQSLPAERIRVRAKLHVVRRDGRLAYSPVEIRQRFREANVHLERANIELVQHGQIDIIDEPDFFNFPDEDGVTRPLVQTYNAPDAIDLYFVNELDAKAGLGFVGGTGDLDGGLIDRDANEGTLAHEVGHILGLHHTHSPDTFDDTPPDPGPGICHDHWEQFVEDLLGCDCSPGNNSCQPDCPDGERPEPRFVMSYYRCGSHLTHSRWSALQIKRMHCQIRDGVGYALIGEACVDRDGDGFSADVDDDCLLSGLDCDDRQPTINPMAAEQCNGLDDDCDGRVDEDTSVTMGRDDGACRSCTAECVDGVLEACEFVDPTPETCNGNDDDCDGRIDEDLDPLSEAIEMRCPDQGICAEQARQVCVDGAWTCELPVGYMAEECPVREADQVCAFGDQNDPSCDDGIDNDCDGIRDEHNPIFACRDHPRFAEIGTGCFNSGGRGRCGEQGGTYRCLQLAEACGVEIACVGGIASEAERCDGADWDCDGAAGNRGDLDGDGYGDCPGSADCNERDASVFPGARELCDNRDNDCDGRTDEGFGQVMCGLGQCRRSIPACVAGDDNRCTDARAMEGRLNEQCNGLDDDCDGQTDEGDTCTPSLDLPNIGVFNLDLFRGDREFGGNGPSVVITVNIDPDAADGIRVRACVNAQELGGDTGAERCEHRHIRTGGRRVALVNEDYAYFRLQYIDTDHGRDDAIAERRVGSLYVTNPAVLAVSCNGDRRGDDVCGGIDCVGCQIDLGNVPVRILR